jgi:hypothetical protein
MYLLSVGTGFLYDSLRQYACADTGAYSRANGGSYARAYNGTYARTRG